MGSAINNKIEDLVNGMDIEYQKFIQEGIMGVLKYRGLFREDKIKEYEERPCSYCEAIYKN